MQRLAVLIYSAGYAGFIPFAPGTFGAMVGLAVYGGLRWAGAPLAVECGLLVLLFAVGAWSATVAERHFGLHDPGQVVIDEVVGMMVTLLLTGAGWSGAATGFLVFRFFDIVKPYPAGRLERLRGGLGIMADDVMAGIYANMALRILMGLAPSWVA